MRGRRPRSDGCEHSLTTAGGGRLSVVTEGFRYTLVGRSPPRPLLITNGSRRRAIERVSACDRLGRALTWSIPGNQQGEVSAANPSRRSVPAWRRCQVSLLAG